MATKKAVAKQTAAPAKAPVHKMTKTQLIRHMAEQMEVPPKQIAAFFDLLIGTATTRPARSASSRFQAWASW